MPDSFDREKSLDRQIRAFHWIRLLAELPNRFAGSRGEREAAARVESWLRDLGVEDVSRSPVTSRPRQGLVLALHLGLAALACWLGGLVGVLLGGLSAVSFHRETRRGASLLGRLLPRADSLNVVGRAGARAPACRVVLSAHIDTTQAGWIFSPRLTGLFARRAQAAPTDELAGVGRPPPGPMVLPERLLMAAALVTTAGWLGAEGGLFAILVTAVGALCAVGFAATLQWALAPATPGANDNASAVAAMLTCTEQLLAQLPEEAELWIVGSGAEEVGCRGMRAFLDAHPEWPRETTLFVNFECVGGGALHYVRSEGTLTKTGYPPTLVELARRVAASRVFEDVTPIDLLAATDGAVPAARGYPTLSLISLEADGVPRNYHRANDLPEAVDMPTVIRAADFGAAVIRAAVDGQTDPLVML